MADTWWRFYNTAPEHPKVLKLSDAAFRAWATLNSLASKLGGVIPDDMELIALTLRKQIGKARELVQILLSAALLDRVEGGYAPHNWTEKQFKSDVSTERVKRFRERNETRKRNGPETETNTETNTETERKKKAAPLGRFDEFWLVCPKKTGRGAAEKAWPRAVSIASEQILIDGMRAYAGSVVGKDKTFTKTPGPWLNGKHWLDEGIAPVAPPDPEKLAADLDKRDRLLRKGKYDPMNQIMGTRQ